MPRIRQRTGEYQTADFWAEIDRRCPAAGIQSGNDSAIARVLSAAPGTAAKYRLAPRSMRVESLAKLVDMFHPDPAAVLRLVGYPEREINRFREGTP